MRQETEGQNGVQRPATDHTRDVMEDRTSRGPARPWSWLWRTECAAPPPRRAPAPHPTQCHVLSSPAASAAAGLGEAQPGPRPCPQLAGVLGLLIVPQNEVRVASGPARLSAHTWVPSACPAPCGPWGVSAQAVTSAGASPVPLTSSQPRAGV